MQRREVASLLEAAGYVVLRPTLARLGERVHLANSDVDLNLHVQDILNVLAYEDVRRHSGRITAPEEWSLRVWPSMRPIVKTATD